MTRQDEALELLRQHYSETEAWKVAQLAATIMAGGYYAPTGCRPERRHASRSRGMSSPSLGDRSMG